MTLHTNNRRVFVTSSRPSNGARDLARGLGARRIRLQNSNYRPRPTDLVINWGNSGFPYQGVVPVNKPEAVRVAANKLHSFLEMSEAGVRTVPFTVNRETAQQWEQEGSYVYCRMKLTGSAGEGIDLVRDDELPDAPLYTRRVRNNLEYRLHVLREEVFDFQRKMRRRGEEADRMIRSHDNGWIFAREGVELNNDMREQAVNAVQSLGLDFGAVDLVVGLDGLAYVLEVNTAPGLEGETLQSYVDVFKEVCSES